MGKKRSTPAPLQPEDREALLSVVHSSVEPLDASKVAKQASTSRKTTPQEAATILDALVSDGRLHAIPPRTAKGKPRYWDRDPVAVTRTAILECLEASEEPLTVQQLKRKLKLPFKPTDAEINSALEECTTEGRAHVIPAKTAKSGPRFWKHDAVEFARRCLLAELHKKGPQAETTLKRSIKWLGEGETKQLLSSMIDSRTLMRHPPVGTSKKVVFGDGPPSPEPYLKDIENRLSKVVDKLKTADVPLVELRRAVVQLVTSAGVPIDQSATEDRPQGKTLDETPVDLVAIMKQIVPGAERGALVTTRDLRQAADLSKSEFDALAVNLSRQGKLVLHRHDFASSLSSAERAELVTDGQGNYYVGMAIRTNGPR